MKVRTMRIMVVDDDPFMVKLLVGALRRLGHHDPIACQSGAVALLEIAQSRHAIDLILLDLHLPGMDGIEFIRELAGHGYGGSIILISGESEKTLHGAERLLHAQQLTSLGHLRKPITLDSLRDLMAGLRPNLGRTTASCVREEPLDGAELRTAIAQRQFVNYYQPQVCVATAEVVGMECLVRWQHPHKGLISPDRFIALAEQQGVMSRMTQTIIASALEHCRSWQRPGMAVPVAVNVTMEDLDALDFPDRLAQLVRESGLSPDLISLEVTESRVMGRPSRVLDVLNRLRLKRFRLAIDDFGTGQSTLAQLRDLPFDELKADRSFVHGATADETLRAIAKASLRMAHQLKMQAVAEGVEDQSDWDFARRVGFDVVQGYFIAPPMPAAEVNAWLGRRRMRTAGTSLALA